MNMNWIIRIRFWISGFNNLLLISFFSNTNDLEIWKNSKKIKWKYYNFIILIIINKITKNIKKIKINICLNKKYF